MQVRVVVSGRVQGVAFRDSTRREAERHGVAGWVRNLPDGRVEALFDGPAAAVEALVHWCHRGPPSAQVTGVQRFDGEADSVLPRELGFRVLR